MIRDELAAPPEPCSILPSALANRFICWADPAITGWAAAAGPVVVSASGWPLRLVRWPGVRYSVGAVEVPAVFPARERAAGLTGRRAECGALDRLVEAVQAGESRARSEEHTSELQSPVHLVC